MKPTTLALTEDEAQQVKDCITVKLLGYWYKVWDIDDILWDSGEGDYYSGTDFSDHGDTGYLEATLYVTLVDGTELEVEPDDPDTDHHLLHEWIDPM